MVIRSIENRFVGFPAKCKALFKHANSPPEGGEFLQAVTKASQSLRPQTQKIPIIFSGGVYGGENTVRLANVRAWRVRCSEPQLFHREPSEAVLCGDNA